MDLEIRAYDQEHIREAISIWNDIVEDGIAFPQMDLLTEESGDAFFSQQSFTGLAYDKDSKSIAGLYILHPNNIGRCGHISNTSYAVKKGMRGHHIGERLVVHSLGKAKELGFRIMQFNAVVRTNENALHLYEKLGFVRLGIVPQGFLMKDGTYEDIVPHYRVL
ncbi:GNAT family N-acetyltransferase [Youngiibacter fragilis]|uniref:N-acetyltransferase GCN5 n=1 Tax=Youngiibacter fragilis 232.1 TaxID=994573 RepID=V7I3G9_9CLOT|nr:GNAT family N-acetyltransferase [Youngiibacter fragilis]ETA79729.1 N-acetyltransferase GCN5 [Youngiibacter fragilis 232.1]